uniref:(California timema) hypothetical protein n=1 Tax=Timema californicum TaxID=61474 RepID=A0A7R9P3Y4_TIMCA|nr:unnamed protein product [Timema californicum]
MPDVSRSDSQRSDASQRPRVSFNRDVHVKRIGNPGAPRVVGALAGDGEGHLVSLPVRRERPTRLSRRELAKEAQRVLHQADRIACTSTSLLEPGNKARFSTLPPLRSNHKHRRRNKSLSEDSPASSLDRNIKHKNPLASVFYSLDRSRTKKNNKLTNGHAEKSILSKKNSSSLSDLLQTSSSSPERINSFKTKRTKLVRSASDSGKSSKSSSPDKTKNFLSLRRNKTRKSRSDYSDTSPSPPLRGIKKKKSHSDSEAPLQFLVPDTVQVEGNVKKKQLSPIIEASPKEDYFEGKRCASKNINREENKVTNHKRGGLVSSEDTMHSSQVTPKPVLTRGRNVDVMVKRLSQDTKLGRGPPRHLNTAVGLVAPGEERQHNNNLPFSYTKSTPTAHDRAAPRGGVSKLSDGVVAGRPAAPTDGQVIYAEVVVSGGSGNGTLNKQTIHTQVPTDRRSNKDPAPQPPKLKSEPVQVSDEDEGLGLTMDYGNGYRRSSAEYLESEIKSYGKKGFRMGDDSLGNDYSTEMNGYKGKQREYTSFGGQDKFGINNNNNLKNSSRLVRVDYGKDMTGSVSKKEYVVHESSRYESGDYIMDPPGRGRADGMDSWKKESMMENYERYEDDCPRRKERDSNMSPIRMVDDYVGNKGFKTEYRSESRFSKDEVDNDRHYRRGEVKHDPLIEPQIINRNDLSLRRDRLQSRIESKSTERLINSRLQQEKRDVLDSKVDDSNKKYPSDTRIPSSDAAFHNRREFLNSQINFDKIPIKSDARYENEKSYANNSRFIESIATETDSYSRKDILADSGIEVDYRKDSTGTMGHSAYDDNLINKGHLSPSKQKLTLNGRQPHNVSKVDLNGHSKERISDSEDVVENNQYHHGSNRNTSYSKQTTSDSFMSTRLVKEQKKTTEAIPSSTVLIRHYAPSSKESTTDLRSNSKYQNLSHVNTDPQEEQMDPKEWNTKEQLREEDRNENDELKKKEGKKKENKQKETEKKEEIKTVPKKKPVTTMDKMRQLFSRGDTKTLKKNKKDDKVKGGKMKKGEDEREDPLTSRYSEYKGSNMVMNESTPRSSSRLQQQRNFSSDMEDDNWLSFVPVVWLSHGTGTNATKLNLGGLTSSVTYMVVLTASAF